MIQLLLTKNYENGYDYENRVISTSCLPFLLTKHWKAPVECDLDCNGWSYRLVFFQDMVPPKDPYIKVRVLEDLGSGIILSDKSANFASHSMHFLKRTDAEQYIARVGCFLPVSKLYIMRKLLNPDSFLTICFNRA